MEFVLLVLVVSIISCFLFYFILYIRGIFWSVSVHSMIKNLERAYGMKINIIIDKKESNTNNNLIEKL